MPRPDRLTYNVRLKSVASIFLLVPLTSALCNVHSLPIGNVTLSNKQTARGLGLAIGTPPQALAFLPHFGFNDSIVFQAGESNCFTPGLAIEDSCTTYRGGQYAPLTSTRRTTENVTAKPDENYWSLNTWFTDSLKWDDELTIENFHLGSPFKIVTDQQGYAPMNVLGLGPDSILLQDLMSKKRIASRTWSMFWGRVGATLETQMSGRFVLGGYDQSMIVAENNLTRNLDYGQLCGSGLLTNLTNIVLNFHNGTDVSLWGRSPPPVIPICIEPSMPGLMNLGRPEFVLFETLTGGAPEERSYGIKYYTMLYSSNDANVYRGDITLRIDDELDIRIPNDQLILPNREIQANGAISANGSSPNLPWNSLQAVNLNDPPKLGRIFLTSAYVMANQDSGTWTLWQASPTLNQSLVAVDRNNNRIDLSCSPGSPSSSTPNNAGPSSHASTTPSSPPIPASSSSLLSGGAIAGVAIGAALAVASLTVLIFLLYRRHMASSKIPEFLHTTSENTDPSLLPYGSPMAYELLGSAAEHEVHAESRGSRMSELEAKLSPRISELEASPLPNTPEFPTA